MKKEQIAKAGLFTLYIFFIFSLVFLIFFASKISLAQGVVPGYTKYFRTGFESASEFSQFYITPQEHLNSTSHGLSTEQVRGGAFAHKAWIYAPNDVQPYTNTNHRGYPTIQLYKTNQGTFRNKVFVEFWAWLDMTLEKIENKDWFSLATFTTYADDWWARALLVNLDADNIVHLMHLPDQGQKVHDIFQTTTILFPMRQWVKISVLLDFTTQNEYGSPYAKVWQNDQLVSAGRFNPRINPVAVDRNWWPACLTGWNGNSIEQAESLCNMQYADGLAQAHFGMYAPPLISSGTVYNDDLAIYEYAASDTTPPAAPQGLVVQ